jgi:hypothetical protein
MDFEQYLPPFDTQTVYVPYANGITVVAEAADSGATVNSPVSANSLKVDVPTAVTVTVSKDLSGVDTSLTAKDYILNLYYGEGVPPDPLAEGGYVSFVPGNNGANSYDEVHRFLYNSGVAEELKFNTAPQDLTARVLVVAGGGGGGRGGFPSGGGGAGGMTETDSYPITEQAYAAVVGAGGAGGTVTGTQGANGENSSFGGGGNPLEAGGGGGGGGHSGQKDGGIRGGLAGSQPNGFSGGSAGYSYTAAGGNGAGGTGKSVSSSNDRNGFYQYSNSGGAGKGSDITGKEVTYAAGGGTAYARYATGVHGSPNTGNGGGGALDGAGGNGGSGIVIVRFPHTGVPAE